MVRILTTRPHGHYAVGRYVRSNVYADMEVGFQTTRLRGSASAVEYKNTRYVHDLAAIATL